MYSASRQGDRSSQRTRDRETAALVRQMTDYNLQQIDRRIARGYATGNWDIEPPTAPSLQSPRLG